MGSMQESYLIVGAGVFGVSTALHLKQSNPTSNVTLLDQADYPNPSAASHDLNKIVRADYDDIFYMKLALEAQRLWRDDPLYKPYYHETGMLFAEDMGMCRKCVENYQTLGEESDAKMITPDEARTRFPEFKDAEWSDVEESYYNPASGWGEAEPALRSVIQAALNRGVKYVVATVSTLSINEIGACTGVRSEDGRELTADYILLCTGARTAKLLADSAPHDEKLQVNGRMVAAAAVSCTVRVAPEHLETLKHLPVFANLMDHTHGESVPLTSNGLLKFNHETSFTNMIYHEASNQTISHPPDPISQSTWTDDVPEGLKQECLKVVRNTYGKTRVGLEIESYRMCWDAVTPNQDWIVSPHPHCPNLYIAGGGSFHSWKFLPVLGAYVAAMLHGKLDAEKAGRWAWDRGNEGAACVMYIPQRDLKDIAGYTKK